MCPPPDACYGASSAEAEFISSTPISVSNYPGPWERFQGMLEGSREAYRNIDPLQVLHIANVFPDVFHTLVWANGPKTKCLILECFKQSGQGPHKGVNCSARNYCHDRRFPPAETGFLYPWYRSPPFYCLQSSRYSHSQNFLASEIRFLFNFTGLCLSPSFECKLQKGKTVFFLFTSCLRGTRRQHLSGAKWNFCTTEWRTNGDQRNLCPLIFSNGCPIHRGRGHVRPCKVESNKQRSIDPLSQLVTRHLDNG